MNGLRAAGVLCHISSLPGKYGIGSLGKEAYAFAKLLAKSGVKYWQILPLVQTGYGDSPYSSVSGDSGNPYFIDLPELFREGLLLSDELKAAELPAGKIDYGKLYQTRYTVLRKAFSRKNLEEKEFHDFVKSGVAEDYALYMTAKTVYGGSFTDWGKSILHRDADALETLRTEYHEEYLFWQFLQFEFDKQWRALKAYCNGLGLKIIGDIPLYVAADSADVWAHPELFKLDKNLKPKKVAGVPPDYFSETGQLWGNPVYDWKAHKAEDYAWWTGRLNRALSTYDVVRIDHFRGINSYYEINAGEPTAEKGEWQDGPQEELFKKVTNKENIIAEDLGDIDEGVCQLLKKTGFAGMKVLLFAFDGNPDNLFLPRNIGKNCVCYTGTHDNSTVAGYVNELSAEDYILCRSRVASELAERGIALKLAPTEKSACNAFVQMALECDAELAVIPVQDLLALNNDNRMNYPGEEQGNWRFRLNKMPSRRIMKRLKKNINKYGR